VDIRTASPEIKCTKLKLEATEKNGQVSVELPVAEGKGRANCLAGKVELAPLARYRTAVCCWATKPSAPS
jgi:hypothetical protein